MVVRLVLAPFYRMLRLAVHLEGKQVDTFRMALVECVQAQTTRSADWACLCSGEVVLESNRVRSRREGRKAVEKDPHCCPGGRALEQMDSSGPAKRYSGGDESRCGRQSASCSTWVKLE